MSPTAVRAWCGALGLSLGLGVVASGAHASATSASSVVSEGASASVGSLSASVQASSQSVQRVAGWVPGDYRVADVSAHSEDGAQLRVQLVPVAAAAAAAAVPGAPASGLRTGPAADAGRPLLVLPAAAVRAAALEVGSVLRLRERAYGLELAQGEPRRAFFLLLRDEALPDLQTRPVPLAAPVRL